ncbi:MAG: DUF1934 domain-containing protein [Clostridiales bacterium]|nr:DUF1934 domain-containing protein [Clostridiales bacterium]
MKSERPVKIKIMSTLSDYSSEYPAFLVDMMNTYGNVRLPQSPFPEKIELITEGILRDTGDRIELEYEETELTGMEGATTTLSYDKQNPNIITVLRDGSIQTALVFEEGVRHICMYETLYMPIELCVATTTLTNELTFEGGQIALDYLIETGGEQAERTRLSISILS